MIDGTVLFELIKESFEVGDGMSDVRGSGLCFLVAAIVAFECLILCFFLKSFEYHFSVGFGFAHLFKFEYVITLFRISANRHFTSHKTVQMQ